MILVMIILRSNEWFYVFNDNTHLKFKVYLELKYLIKKIFPYSNLVEESLSKQVHGGIQILSGKVLNVLILVFCSSMVKIEKYYIIKNIIVKLFFYCFFQGKIDTYIPL